MENATITMDYKDFEKMQNIIEDYRKKDNDLFNCIKTMFVKDCSNVNININLKELLDTIDPYGHQNNNTRICINTQNMNNPITITK